MSKTTKQVEWYDDVNVDSWLLASTKYNVKLKLAETIDENTVILKVTGDKKAVDEFESDVEDGNVMPLDEMSRAHEYDEDYEKALNEAIAKVKENA